LSARLGIIWLGGNDANSLLLAIERIVFFSNSLNFLGVCLAAPFLLSDLSKVFFQRSKVLTDKPNIAQALFNLAPFVLASVIN
jgi:hypothetical protein